MVTENSVSLDGSLAVTEMRCSGSAKLAKYSREFGISDPPRKLNRQLEKVADSFGNITDM